MEFKFTPEQEALRDAARDLFERESPPSRLRALWDGEARRTDVWRKIAEMGIAGITVPDEHGGIGGDETDLALVLIEAGRAALPEPIVETVAVVAPLLGSVEDDAIRERWLPAIASGEARAAVSLGGSAFAFDADTADVLVAEQDGALHVLARGEFQATPVPAEDRARTACAVTFDPSPVAVAPGALERAHARGAWASACVLLGIAQRETEMTVEYVKGRQQFGRAVGSFQAVKHKLADCFVKNEMTFATVSLAAYALARDLPDAGRQASAAKVAASDAESWANTTALQCHAGIGFTWEHDLHLWLKRGHAMRNMFGTPAAHRARLASAVFEELA